MKSHCNLVLTPRMIRDNIYFAGVISEEELYHKLGLTRMNDGREELCAALEAAIDSGEVARLDDGRLFITPTTNIR